MTRGELILESLLNGDYLTAREVIGESLAEDSTDYIQDAMETAQLDESEYGLQDLSEDLIGEYFGLNENEDDELADMSRDLVEEYLSEASTRAMEKRRQFHQDKFMSTLQRGRDKNKQRLTTTRGKSAGSTSVSQNWDKPDAQFHLKQRNKYDRLQGITK